MDEENKAFCTQCGAILPEGAQYCPKCSAQCGNDASGVDTGTQYNCVSESRLDTTGTFVIIYAVLASLFGIIMLVSMLSITSEIWNEAMQSLAEQGIDAPMTFDQFKTYASIIGGCELASGVFAFISYYMIKNRTKYIVALISCILATITSISGIITLIIGLYMVYRIYTSKQCFKN